MSMCANANLGSKVLTAKSVSFVPLISDLQQALSVSVALIKNSMMITPMC